MYGFAHCGVDFLIAYVICYAVIFVITRLLLLLAVVDLSAVTGIGWGRYKQTILMLALLAYSLVLLMLLN